MPEIPATSTRSEHAAAVARRMVDRACWLISLEEAYVSEETKSRMIAETTDMLLAWAAEIGEESFRAGEFSARTVA